MAILNKTSFIHGDFHCLDTMFVCGGATGKVEGRRVHRAHLFLYVICKYVYKYI